MPQVIETKLANGLTILVHVIQDMPLVALQLWYNVGSKHEKEGERGLAHFLEHMIFKGTKMLSESDIDLVTTKLSGYANAFTWCDYTGYVFNIPKADWHQMLPIFADCMQNCTFDPEHINSELKAVIQEMKMRKDNHACTLFEAMQNQMFITHPYHYSTIGTKQNLWSIDQSTLMAFYKQYYHPDNAVLVIVGDVDPADVHTKVEQAFGKIPQGSGWNNKEFYYNKECQQSEIIMYQNINQPISMVGYIVPGLVEQKELSIQILIKILSAGMSSRLYKKLVDKLQLVSDIQFDYIDFFDKGILIGQYTPYRAEDIKEINKLIQEEITDIADHGPTQEEVEHNYIHEKINQDQIQEDVYAQACRIGKYFLATKDPHAAFSYQSINPEQVANQIQKIAQECSSILQYQGSVLPIPDTYKHIISLMQNQSDQLDTEFLSKKIRISPVKEGSYVHSVSATEMTSIDYKIAQSIKLTNGLECMWYNNPNNSTITMMLQLAIDEKNDPADKQGIGLLISKLMNEGSINYKGQALADAFKSHGIIWQTSTGCMTMSMLPQHAHKALELMTEMMSSPEFTDSSLDKIKTSMLTNIEQYWDNPQDFYMQIAKQAVYKNHLLAQMHLGVQSMIKSITMQDCIDYYQSMISPYKGRLIIVGNLENIDAQNMITKTIGQWQGPIVKLEPAISIEPTLQQEIVIFKERDQILLAFAGLSVNRFDQDYHALKLFDEILVRGMSSRLFQLRQRSGLFYSISGSLVLHATDYPGMILIKTLVSCDRINEAIQAISDVLNTAIDDLTDEEVTTAKRKLLVEIDKSYSSTDHKITTFNFLKKYDLPDDFYVQEVAKIKNLSCEQIKTTVRKFLSTDKLALIKIGRI